MTLDRPAPPHSCHPPTLARPAGLKGEGVHLFAFRVKMGGSGHNTRYSNRCVSLSSPRCYARRGPPTTPLRGRLCRVSLHSIRTLREGDTTPLGSLCL
ncbi:hypothetical protein E2C01_040408 [Portunus trituberculatus]|uniref:Uncharacterized protein n=1 Tax=Portunus trituberculatus TaxID=210409 RepID=A0A5B7FNP7_PORTR|nr:hypothetical protein [Portunus trituberculatus]